MIPVLTWRACFVPVRYVAKLRAFYDEATTQVAAMEAALTDSKARNDDHAP